MADQDRSYQILAREVVDAALGGTFEQPDAVPRRDAFIRDATDLLARFVATRCGNPGFHSAKFFDAVVSIAAARDRIRDAARRSRVVERLVEGEKRTQKLEAKLRERDEQLVRSARGDAGSLAVALQAADARIRVLEDELSESKKALAAAHALIESYDLPSPVATPVRGGDKVGVAPHEDDGEFAATAEVLEKTAEITIRERTKEMPAFVLPDDNPSTDPEPRAEPPRPARPDDQSALDPERRLAAARTELELAAKERAQILADKELVDLERDALRAQLEQLSAREKAVRRECDETHAKCDLLEQEVEELTREKNALDQERNEAARARAALEELRVSGGQELALLRIERDAQKAASVEKEAEVARARGDAARALALAEAAEARGERESTAASRARRESGEARLERDRLKLELSELRPIRERHDALLAALAHDPGTPTDEVVSALARRSEVVLVHEPPDFAGVASRLENARSRGAVAAAAKEAALRLARSKAASSRYDELVSSLQGGEGGASVACELARILAVHGEDVRWLELVEGLAA